MSKREIEFYIVDIFIAIDKINRYSQKFNNAQELLHSDLEWDATIRELEIIGEATNVLLKSDILDKEYRIIVDFRNQINHGYFGINENIVWDVIKNYLIEFRLELLNVININNINLSGAIECAKEDNKFSKKTMIFLDVFSTELYEEMEISNIIQDRMKNNHQTIDKDEMLQLLRDNGKKV